GVARLQRRWKAEEETRRRAQERKLQEQERQAKSTAVLESEELGERDLATLKTGKLLQHLAVVTYHRRKLADASVFPDNCGLTPKLEEEIRQSLGQLDAVKPFVFRVDGLEIFRRNAVKLVDRYKGLQQRLRSPDEPGTDQVVRQRAELVPLILESLKEVGSKQRDARRTAETLQEVLENDLDGLEASAKAVAKVTLETNGADPLGEMGLADLREFDSGRDASTAAARNTTDAEFKRLQFLEAKNRSLFLPSPEVDSCPPEFAKILDDAVQALCKEKMVLRRLAEHSHLRDFPLTTLQRTFEVTTRFLAKLRAMARQLGPGLDRLAAYQEAFRDVSRPRSLEPLRKVLKKLQGLDDALSGKAAQLDEVEMTLRHASGAEISALEEQRDALKAELDEHRAEKEEEILAAARAASAERDKVVQHAKLHFPELVADKQWLGVVDAITVPEKYPNICLGALAEDDKLVLPLGLDVRLVDCEICKTEFRADEGVECDSGHFMCGSCLEGHLKAISSPGFDGALTRKDNTGAVPCFDPKCKSTPHHPQTVGRFVSQETYDGFMAAVKRGVEQQTVQTMNSEFERRRKQLEEEVQGDSRVQVHMRHITENILTLKCPSGGHAFVDFSGCFALVCTRCVPQSTFCAWCLADCGKDAHQHVAYCEHNLAKKKKGARTYYGTAQNFEQARIMR
ncbi:Uncharacterized protein SCF082_LOCUS25871, partial [Durusdinium trenchii]